MSAKKYCPAIPGMLYLVCGMNCNEISEVSGIPQTSIQQILVRKYGKERLSIKPRVNKADVDIHAIEADYLSGISTYEIAEKYNVHHSTISTWMNELGHYRGKGHFTSQTKNRLAKKRADKSRRNLENRLKNDFDGKFELVKFGKEKHVFKCLICGCVFERWKLKTNENLNCPDCKSFEIENRKAKREAKLKADKIRAENLRKAEYDKEKICASCGSVFHSESRTKLYCSDTCSRRAKRNRDSLKGIKKPNYRNHRKRARIHGVDYEPGITLKKLIERDSNTCKICGLACDKKDLRWGTSGPLYPTIDHVIAMANGGGHTWDNVQLAHAICNSYKRDLSEDELQKVVDHAKEQAISYKCA